MNTNLLRLNDKKFNIKIKIRFETIKKAKQWLKKHFERNKASSC